MGRLPTKSSQPFASCWRNRRIALPWRVAVLLLFTGGSMAEPLSTSHWALFNTVCARCHEGQCSGRLSLDAGDNQSRVHVERYAGALNEELHQQLVVYLQHMKELCGFSAIPLSITPQEFWSELELQPFRTPSGNAYFLPLGMLTEGSYRLQVRITGVDWSAQVVSAGFDILSEKAASELGNEFGLEFHAAAGSHYLRVIGRDLLQLQQVRLVRLDEGAH